MNIVQLIHNRSDTCGVKVVNKVVVNAMPTLEMKSPAAFRRVLLICISLLLAAAVWIGVMLAFPGRITLFAGIRPTNLGVHSDQLAPCPSTPNCVSSQSVDAEHSIEPFAYNSSPEKALTDLKTVIQSLDKTKVITETENYLYVEFTSAIMGFVDDVEFYLDQGTKVIHVRSASRLGESDLGVNRKRIETISAKFNTLNREMGNVSAITNP